MQTDGHTNLIVAFRNFPNSHKDYRVIYFSFSFFLFFFLSVANESEPDKYRSVYNLQAWALFSVLVNQTTTKLLEN